MRKDVKLESRGDGVYLCFEFDDAHEESGIIIKSVFLLVTLQAHVSKYTSMAVMVNGLKFV